MSWSKTFVRPLPVAALLAALLLGTGFAAASQSWKIVPSPNVSTTGDNYLFGVAGVSKNDVWAVGYYNLSTSTQTLIEQWNGASWTVVSSPNPDPKEDVLFGVAAASATKVWAVGYHNSTSISGTQTLIDYWDGTSWSVVSSPNVEGMACKLQGVAAISAENVWAVGYCLGSAQQTLIEHWNGTNWSIVSSPNVGTASTLNGVTAVSGSNLWAVGYYQRTANFADFPTLIEHWNGTSWSVVSSPNVGTVFNSLNGVMATSADNVWAAGYYENASSGISQTLIEHWTGTGWSVVSSPNVGTLSNLLNGVAATSAKSIWAVGYNGSASPYEALIEHWNGSAWSVVSGPSGALGYTFLRGVAAVAKSDQVWAVGNQAGSPTGATLIERYGSEPRSPDRGP